MERWAWWWKILLNGRGLFIKLNGRLGVVARKKTNLNFVSTVCININSYNLKNNSEKCTVKIFVTKRSGRSKGVVYRIMGRQQTIFM